MKTSKVYDKLIRVVNVKTGNIQFVSQFIADDIQLLERYGFKIDDPEYLKFLGKDVKEDKLENKTKTK